MSSVALGATAATGQRANSLGQALEWAVQAARVAHERGTFAVGGVLLAPDGTLLARCSNRVLHEGRLVDPTAHGERQLVDWYFEARARGRELPAPQDCLLVSSLDPCLMCAGALLATGFPVLSLALDPAAGVNWQGDASFACLPSGLRPRAQRMFAYAGVEGVRPYQGPGPAVSVSRQQEAGCAQLFRSGAADIQRQIYGAGALGSPTPAGILPGACEAAVFGPQGELLYGCSLGAPVSPIRTPFMELMRGWAEQRARNPGLPHLKQCTVLTRTGPGLDGLGLMELGAYGSSLEGPPQGRWQYLTPAVPQVELDLVLAALPPLYRDVIGLRVEARS